MYKIYGICILLVFILISCSSKEGFVLEEETPESILAKAETAYQNKNYDESIKMVNILLENFPTSDLHVEAQTHYGQISGWKRKI